MIYGIDAPDYLIATPGGGGYNASAVHFDGATSLGGTLSCTDNVYTGFSAWLKASSSWTLACLWSVHRDNLTDQFNYYTPGHQIFEAAGGDLSPTFRDITFATTGTWHHFLGAIQAGTVAKLYVDDVSVGTQTLGTNSAFTWNGKDVWIADDGWDEAFFTGDMADVSLWPGVNLFTAGDIAEATRRLFIDATLKPVDPATAIASLGTPSVMLSGGPATFANNSLGSSGAFSVVNGSLSGATGP